MSRCTISHPLSIDIDTMPRFLLADALSREAIEMNESALTLLQNSVFDDPIPHRLTVVERSLGELGLEGGGALSEIFAAATASGLKLCPPTTGPYLRLLLRSQGMAPDSIMSNGRAPSGSLTIGSAPLELDAEYPKGFYLRVIEGRPWLRGYRCDDEHVWGAGDRFVFATDGRGRK